MTSKGKPSRHLGHEFSCLIRNIHRCRGTDGILDPDRTLATLHDEQPVDLINALFLQEGDEECPPHARLVDNASVEVMAVIGMRLSLPVASTTGCRSVTGFSTPSCLCASLSRLIASRCSVYPDAAVAALPSPKAEESIFPRKNAIYCCSLQTPAACYQPSAYCKRFGARIPIRAQTLLMTMWDAHTGKLALKAAGSRTTFASDQRTAMVTRLLVGCPLERSAVPHPGRFPQPIPSLFASDCWSAHQLIHDRRTAGNSGSRPCPQLDPRRTQSLSKAPQSQRMCPITERYGGKPSLAPTHSK